jgi:L-threonylcarbamoyladenylate synthase
MSENPVSTRIWRIATEEISLDNMACLRTLVTEPAALLAASEAIAFPTETVYGLGGNALSDIAIAKIFHAKGRPSDNPLIVHCATVEQVLELVIVEEIPSIAHELMRHFWPGPLTILLPKRPGLISDKATAGLSKVGMRIPKHPVALALIAEANVPVAAPSANVSGRPSPTLAKHVEEDLTGRIAGIVDGGAAGVGVESTVVECSDSGEIVICRPGGVTMAHLEAVAGKGKVSIDPAVIVDVQQHEAALKKKDDSLKPKAPGMKYRHYSPKAKVILIEGDDQFFRDSLLAQRASLEGRNAIGILASKELISGISVDDEKFIQENCAKIEVVGSRADLEQIARNLYDCLRAFDSAPEVELILAECFESKNALESVDIRQAVMNRLLKASSSVLKQK